MFDIDSVTDLLPFTHGIMSDSVLSKSSDISDIYSSAMNVRQRGGGLGSRPKKMYGERLGDGVEYHLMKPTPRR